MNFTFVINKLTSLGSYATTIFSEIPKDYLLLSYHVCHIQTELVVKRIYEMRELINYAQNVKH